MSNPITPEFIEQANTILKNARKETLDELFELGQTSAGKSAGEWVSGREVAPGVSTMPNYSMNAAAIRIMDILYELDLIISFKWMDWDEGRELLTGRNVLKLEGLPAHKIIGLLTALARNDRFCDGAWGSAVEEGKVAKLLSELEKRIGVD